jgi:hypothetical protein
MILAIRDYEKSFQNHTIVLNFKGIVCFDRDETKIDDKTGLYPILKKKASNLLTCNTLLSDKDKITIAFYEKRSKIPLVELLR